MKTAPYIMPLIAGVVFAGSTLAHQIELIFTSSNEELTEEQLNQDRGECEMWTFEQIGFPEVYVTEKEGVEGKVTVEVRNASESTATDNSSGKANGTFYSAFQRGYEQGRQKRERDIVQKALKRFDEDPEEAIRTIRPIEPELAFALEDRLEAKEEAAQRKAAIQSQYNKNYRHAMAACMTARSYTVN